MKKDIFTKKAAILKNAVLPFAKAEVVCLKTIAGLSKMLKRDKAMA